MTAPATTSDAPAAPGTNEFGTVTLADRVVAKIAGRAVREVPDAGAVNPRGLSRAFGSVSGPAGTGNLPKVRVDVDRSVATIELAMSVRWPAPVGEVSAAVRAHVIATVADLTGLRITDVRIRVGELSTDFEPPPRVR